MPSVGKPPTAKIRYGFWWLMDKIDDRILGHRFYGLCLRIQYGMFPEDFDGRRPY